MGRLATSNGIWVHSKGIRFEVHYVTNEYMQTILYGSERDDWYAGMTILNHGNKIYINKDVDSYALKDILRHECLHILHRLHNQHVLDNIIEINEETVVRLTVPMLDDLNIILEQINVEVSLHKERGLNNDKV